MSKVVEVISTANGALVLYSPTTLKKMRTAGLIPRALNSSAIWQEISSNPGVSYDTLGAYDDYKTYIGLGGGTVIDVAKYLAFKNNAKCIAIPSMLSTNVFATDKVAAIYNGVKTTEPAKVPDEVIVDYDLLALSKQENLYGLVDVFSIHTALKDWVIASTAGQDCINKVIYEKAVEILESAKHVCQIQDSLNPDTLISSIYDVVKQAGEITNEYGNGRPESGSEHIIAKNIEALVRVPHALAVTCGIATMSILQDNYYNATQELKHLGMFQEVQKSPITPSILEQAILNAQPRPGRYTVIDQQVPLFPKRAKELVEGAHIW